MADFIKNSPFRFWCQKVLPLVYDDSLSYYELLCKVVCKLNELAENQNNLSDEIKQVAKDLEDFKNQVPDLIDARVEEWLNNYIATKGLVNSVNGMKGDVTLTASDVGAIPNVNGSVKNNNIADGAVTKEKIADGVIPEKLPNPKKLTFSGAATGEYDGSEALNIDIPTGGGTGGGTVDSVNGMTGNVVLKKLTVVDPSTSRYTEYNGSEDVTVTLPIGGGAVDSVNGMTGDVVLKTLTFEDESTYNGSEALSVNADTVGAIPNGNGAVTSDNIATDAVTNDKIADRTITADKLANGVIPTKLPNPRALTINVNGSSTTYDGTNATAVDINTSLTGTLRTSNGITGGPFDGSKNAYIGLKKTNAAADNTNTNMYFSFAWNDWGSTLFTPVEILCKTKTQVSGNYYHYFSGLGQASFPTGRKLIAPLVCEAYNEVVGVAIWRYQDVGAFDITIRLNRSLEANTFLYASGMAFISES